MAESPINFGTVVVVTADKDFAVLVADALRASGANVGDLKVRAPDKLSDELADPACGLVVPDLDAFPDGPVAGLSELYRQAGPSVRFLPVTGVFDAEVARGFLRLKLQDFLVKPVVPADLAHTLTRLGRDDADPYPDSRIYTFLPAAGGVGNTTLTLQSAVLLHQAAARRHQTTCVVDLNLQNGSCAEYFDLEPHFDIAEIENQPDRLDRKLLDVMLSRHKSGLAIVSAPPCPWEMRSYRPDLVARLLDLVAGHFDNVVIDLPRTWFPWTDSVLQGSDHVFVTTEMTVPALRQAQRLAQAVRERVHKDARFGVIVNRADAGASVSLAEVKQLFGDAFAGAVANDYKAVREALDQGRPLGEVAPNSRVIADLRAIIADPSELATSSWTAPLRALLARLRRTDAPAAAKGRRHA
ncbi:response regulator receiver protein [Pleomorphomonas diazotrophica]|uniref:Response regulator receiver protein n=1 Tax=Pleomorphomonas diazotrophica TaxID=1166257 RepID=A0A1I4TGB1_9HYPH|nr:response regulator receiver protein [Pleomorphomonas diazotrophica]PKR87237.1 response regulator receiver protein [Pleomorphomonas diazotrophica]SFM75756.1 pilus assembly protein CpaE [Pleomorphomonas diazotrophica]